MCACRKPYTLLECLHTFCAPCLYHLWRTTQRCPKFECSTRICGSHWLSDAVYDGSKDAHMKHVLDRAG